MVAIDLSKSTMRRIKLNYFWAFGYNSILVPIAAGIFYPPFQFKLAPMLAGAAMALSSVSIVASSLLLMLYSPPQPPEKSISLNTLAKKTRTGKQCMCPASSAPPEEEEALTWMSRLKSIRSSVLPSRTSRNYMEVDQLEVGTVTTQSEISTPRLGQSLMGEGKSASSSGPDIDTAAQLSYIPPEVMASGCMCGAGNCKCGSNCRCTAVTIEADP
jgi:hypothetical protein